MDDDARFFGLRLDREYIPFEPAEQDDFVYKLEGEIIEGETEVRAGRFRAFYADIESGSAYGYTPRQVLDACQQTYDYADPLLAEDDSAFSDAVSQCLRLDIFGSNLLILDRVELLPDFRGLGIGLLALRRIIERFGAGAAVVALKPFPLQFETPPKAKDDAGWHRSLELHRFRGRPRAATNRLKRHYARLGFVELPGTEVMLMSTAWRLPAVAQLLEERHRRASAR